MHIAAALLLLVASQDQPQVQKPSELDKLTIGARLIALPDIPARIRKDLPPVDRGVVVVYVDPCGPLAESKLRNFTVITKLNDTLVSDAEDVAEVLAKLKEGDTCSVAGIGWIEDKEASAFKADITPTTNRKYALASLVKKRDSATDSITYRHSSSPGLPTDGDALFCYMLKVGDRKPQLRVKMQGAQLQHVGNVKFWIGTSSFALDISPLSVTSIKDAGVWDATVDDKIADAMRRIIDGNIVALCASMEIRVPAPGVLGKPLSDRHISPAEQHAIQAVLLAYEAMTESPGH